MTRAEEFAAMAEELTFYIRDGKTRTEIARVNPKGNLSFAGMSSFDLIQDDCEFTPEEVRALARFIDKAFGVA